MALQSIGLSQSQQQKQTLQISPLQRQSLAILQMPLLKLEQKIREEAQSNPAIEEFSVPNMELDAPLVDKDAKNAESELSENDDDFQRHEPSSSYCAPEDAEERRRYMFESLRQPVSLESHLRMQIATFGFNENENAAAEAIIANLSNTGMLCVTTAEIAEVTLVPVETVESVLSFIKDNFDPPGIAAQSAAERLILQLKNEDSPHAPLAMEIAMKCLDELAQGSGTAKIASKVSGNEEDVICAIRLIKSLNPNPVAEFDDVTPADYVIPELSAVRTKEGRWIAVFDSESAPSISINEEMRSYLERDDISQNDKSYIREHIRSAEMLSSCLKQRMDTIERVGSAIVEEQQDFFTYGVSRLKPMTLSDIAKKVERHETTVGRAVEGKYIRTPMGNFELKYFFSAGIKGKGDSAISNKAVMDRIVSIIRAENPAKPYSDQEILEILSRDGIDIKRRTVAKYRDSLHIPSSGRRRKI